MTELQNVRVTESQNLAVTGSQNHRTTPLAAFLVDVKIQYGITMNPPTTDFALPGNAASRKVGT